MTAPREPRTPCFICGHQREGHDAYHVKYGVWHEFVEPPTGAKTEDAPREPVGRDADLDKLEAEFSGPFADRELYADVPALVAEVRVLRAERDRLIELLGPLAKCRVIHGSRPKMFTCLDEVEQARAVDLDTGSPAYRYDEDYRQRIIDGLYLCVNCRIAFALGMKPEHEPYTTVREAEAFAGDSHP